ncbi:MAG: ferrous iron transport protein [Thermodesulfobacteriota bacterium]|nr:ferrous iron transport protein [Thermodesulfobacteriota bacterium]
MAEVISVAVAGQPNCGKSTMFNAITGAAARVGNYPGITVERLEGSYQVDGHQLRIIDLPGTYSLTSYSPEEIVARDVIVEERPDVVINMLDASALERSLYLAIQLLEMGVPTVIGLNMMDEVRRKGIKIDSKKLSEALGAPVVECVARIGRGKHELMQAVVDLALKSTREWKPLEISYGHDLDPVLREMVAKIEAAGFMTDRYPARWIAVKYLEDDENIVKQGESAGPLGVELQSMVKKLLAHTEKTLNTYPEALVADYRYGFINSILRKGVIKRKQDLRLDVSDHVDRVVTHGVAGPILMVLVLWLMFYVTFNVGAFPKKLLENAFAFLGSLIGSIVGPGLLQSLLVNGIVDGVGAVLSFTPLILIMFAMLVFLEDLGYMARVAYMLDRVFRLFGLHGASVMPFIMSGGIPGGCAVPGIMCSRTLKSPRERLATIFTAPFMVCGAKTTAYIMLTAAFFPSSPALAMLMLVGMAWLTALVMARLLRWTVIKGPSTPFVMELPPYRLPTLKGIAIHTWDRVRQFVTKCATVIFGISVIMWVLMTFPQLPSDIRNGFDRERQDFTRALQQLSSPEDPGREALKADLESQLRNVDADENEAALRYSIAGRIGVGLEPLSRLAGFPWQVNIALLGAFAAKEVFVSTMATAYSMNNTDPEEASSLSQRLAADPVYTLPAILSLFIFILFYAPCMVTLVTIGRESSWGWALFVLVGSVSFAFALSFSVYQVGSLLLA